MLTQISSSNGMPLSESDRQCAHFGNCRMPEDHCLDFGAIDVLASAKNHILLAIEDMQIASSESIAVCHGK